MTTMSALLGALPLMLGAGEGAELQAAARHCHRGRPRREPGAHALYDARRLVYLENIRVSVNRRRGHTVADEVVPGGPVTDAGIPARHM